MSCWPANNKKHKSGALLLSYMSFFNNELAAKKLINSLVTLYTAMNYDMYLFGDNQGYVTLLTCENRFTYVWVFILTIHSYTIIKQIIGGNMQYYSVKQTADKLGISRQWTWQLIKKGELQAVRIGKAFIISDEAINKYINEPNTKSRS